MSPTLPQPQFNERSLLLTLAAVQFFNVLDFMVMMPLGARIMSAFAISPQQFSWLVAAYGIAAALAGFAGAFVLDRFDRKNALLTLFTGFIAATLACALSTEYHTLLISRLAAGAFGGLAGSVVTAMVADVIPPERRGRAMSTVMSAFPLASIAGIPLSLYLTALFDWHAPFFFLTGGSLLVFVLAAKTLPHVASLRSTQSPVAQMKAILSHPVHQRGFLLGGVLIMSGACIMPFMAPTLVANAGISESQLPLIYLVGGVATFIAMPLLGKLSDRFDKFYVLIGVTVPSAIVMLVITNLAETSLPVALLVSALFFVGMTGRFPPTMAMITNSVEARYRGGFMALISAIQQGAAGIANVIAGTLITADASGKLVGYNHAGYVSLTAFILTVWLAARLRAIAPFAAKTPAQAHVACASPPSAGPAAGSTD
jgi:DHA1 family inner membrane transport protein